MTRRWLMAGGAAGVLAVCGAWVGSAAPRAEAPAGARPVVVELFTSEGCSSCPPADAVLSELVATRPDVLALAFHVTYWDRLGWPDPYALDAATRRQQSYAAVLGLGSIYTPQMVIDGTQDVVGSNRRGVLDAIGRADAGAAANLTLARDAAGGIVAQVDSAGAGASQPASVWLAGYDSRHETEVRHGENAGRRLVESNVVRGWVRAGEWSGGRATLRAAAPAGQHVAAVLQTPSGRILAAARLE